MFPSTIIGWIIFIIVVMIIWKNSAAAGMFVFHTVPDHVEAFLGSA
jgi:hypothetical protein